MAFSGPGPGRPKGSKNKYRLNVGERLVAMGCDPFKHMAEVMQNRDAPPELRMRAATELAQYMAPKLKSVEHTGDGTAVNFVIMGAQPDATAEEWERRNQERLQ